MTELFKTKALVSAFRSKTRDWVDLYLLMRDHRFSMDDFRNAFLEAGDPLQMDSALSRLCSGTPQAADEGYLHLLPNPPTIEVMRDFFRQRRNELEISLARAVRPHL